MIRSAQLTPRRVRDEVDVSAQRVPHPTRSDERTSEPLLQQRTASAPRRASLFPPISYHSVTFTVFEPFQTLDGEMYDKVKLYFSTLARSELECCGLTQECFAKILNDSILVRDNVLRS